MPRMLRLGALLAASAAATEITLDGSGTTNPSKFFWEIMSIFSAQAKPAVEMSYRAVGSGTGQFEFVGADQEFTPYADFGSGDIPITAASYQTLKDNNADVLHVPFSLGAMSFFHSVPHDSTLTMTACVLADIMSRTITTWDHPDIKALNPLLVVPAGQPIYVYHRVLGSSTTAGVTTYMNAACPANWPASSVGSSITWAAGTFPADSSSLMSTAISTKPYSFGYIDSGHGHDDGLEEIELQNKFGTFQNSLDAIARGGVGSAADEALLLGVLPADPSADFSGVTLHNMPGEFTWPIVAISYIYLRKDQTANGERAALLYAFVQYVLSTAGQSMLVNYGFQGVPAKVLAVANQALADVNMPADSQMWTFETATNAGSGQKDFVISTKRRSFEEYSILELTQEKASLVDVAAVATVNTAMSAKVASLSAALVALETSLAAGDFKTTGCDCGSSNDDDNLVKDAAAVGTAAIIIALVALCVAIAGVVKVTALQKTNQTMHEQTKEVCLPAVKPSAQAYADLQRQGNEQL